MNVENFRHKDRSLPEKDSEEAPATDQAEEDSGLAQGHQ